MGGAPRQVAWQLPGATGLFSGAVKRWSEDLYPQGSPILSILAMCLVCSSFPFAFAIFAMIINFLALFLILGIGADSVFIFTDL